MKLVGTLEAIQGLCFNFQKSAVTIVYELIEKDQIPIEAGRSLLQLFVEKKESLPALLILLEEQT